MKKVLGATIIALATMVLLIALNGNVQAATDIKSHFDPTFVDAVCAKHGIT